MRICKECLVEKPLTEFYVAQKVGFKGSDGYVRKTTCHKTRCKECSNNQNKVKYHKLTVEEKRERRKNNPHNNFEARQKYRLMQRFNLTMEQYCGMIEEQDNMCKICNVVMDTPCVDHNHTTGKVRHLLCMQCNTSLGLLKENTTTLQNMISYINDNI